MSKTQGRVFLIVCFGLMFLLPLIGSYLRWGGYPPGYGFFPGQKPDIVEPGFSPAYFTFGVCVAVFILSFLLFPGLFGFKKPEKNTVEENKPAVGFPKWFWPSVVVLALSWFFMWGRFKLVEPIDHYTFVPLWWSFILILDSFVYKRTGGFSLVATKPTTMKLMLAASCFSWFIFEYLNYFVCENWYYPNYKIFSDFGNIFWFSLSYTTVLPAIFEWYCLLNTFRPIREKYACGPQISLNKFFQILSLILGFALAFFMAYYPFVLFWGLWVCPMPILAPAMALAGFWTPFSPIKKGNWSPLILIALATVLNGFFWELWNFGSEWFHNDIPTNPNYWKYSVPYLDKIHIFSEMPILGYFGYLFFGVVCWVVWLIFAYICGFDPEIELQDATDKEVA